jgi:hypothetical protein
VAALHELARHRELRWSVATERDECLEDAHYYLTILIIK